MLISNIYAQRFYNLTADEVRIDSVIPSVCQDMLLTGDYTDSVYTAEILYPEFIDMAQSDIDNYKRISGDKPLPALPSVEQAIVYNTKQPWKLFTVYPQVFRDGKYQFLVSFMLKVTSAVKPLANNAKSGNQKRASRVGETAPERYAAHSVLSEGKWVKIQVPSTGYYELTSNLIKKAGFTDINKVHIYGYGGNLVPEELTPEYLAAYDDLKPVKTCIINGKRIFYALGPVSYDDGVTSRTRNPYSDYGCYFITQNDNPIDTISKAEMEQFWYDNNDKHYSLHEVDDYAWMAGGRNLVESTTISTSSPREIKLNAPAHSNYGAGGRLSVIVSGNTASRYSISLNDSTLLSEASISLYDYDKASFSSRTFNVRNLKEANSVKIKCLSGGPLRLDYALLYVPTMADSIDLSTMTFAQPEYVYGITKQDHHADEAVNMTIIIPTSQTLLGQAERIKEFHEKNDNLSVRIVPADELYNEFSSGTPDVSAYRRYMKMQYDRTDLTSSNSPKYLLLFGDCLWDNRLKTSNGKGVSGDDLLLCYESENSYNQINSFVSDDFIGMLDDNETISTNGSYMGTPDIGIGRFPVTTVDAAKVIVDKTIAYATNANVGDWQNTIMFMGDDGNDNLHMNDVNTVADYTISQYPGYYVRKVMWDAYNRVESSTGNRYPEVEALIKKQQKNGTLIMDYAGHGSANAISHEYVLKLTDFQTFSNNNLPLWITASCDLGPFDGSEETIGETIVTNKNGGGVAFYGTTRTVYANYNKYINNAFVQNVLKIENGKRVTLGDANRIAKTYLVTSSLDRTVNKLQYSLLGDPALALNTPLLSCVVDSINGVAVNGSAPKLHANSKVRIAGHIANNGIVAKDFSGCVDVMVRDNAETVTCFNNDGSASKKFTFTDRTKMLYTGVDSVRNGQFSIQFVMPRDINYSDESGLITLFAYTSDGLMTAHGENDHFTVGGTEEVYNDSIGPSVYCYLNSPSFVNGGNVNSTPYFVAEVKDNNGLNTSGAGIGHDMQLIIDNDPKKTYSLNDNFTYDFGSYTSGSTYYYIPELSVGTHQLLFRAWDILNNPSTTLLSFNVVVGLDPNLFDVNVTRNPARTNTTFIITHDRPGADLDVTIDIFDMSGRQLHQISQTVASGTSTSTVTWDLSTDNGSRLQTGVYLYRVGIVSDGSKKVTKAKKLVVL